MVPPYGTNEPSGLRNVEPGSDAGLQPRRRPPIWLNVRSEAGARIGARKLVLPLPGKIVIAPLRRLSDQVRELVAGDVADCGEVLERSSSPCSSGTPAPNVPSPLPGRSIRVSPASRG